MAPKHPRVEPIRQPTLFEMEKLDPAAEPKICGTRKNEIPHLSGETTVANKTYFAVICSSSMNNLGPFGLLAIAVGVAALFVLVGAIPVLVVRNLITRRPAARRIALNAVRGKAREVVCWAAV